MECQAVNAGGPKEFRVLSGHVPGRAALGLARPGGNVTGLTDDAGVEMGGKYLQLLTEAVPTVSRMAVLGYSVDPLNPSSGIQGVMEAEARTLGVTLRSYEIRESEELKSAFAAMTKARAGALFLEGAPFFAVHAQRIVDLAARSRLPAIYPYREHIKAGGLMAYGVNYPDIWRRLGFYVDKILNGATPGDLPVEQPTTFELLINLKTAKALGLTIPPTLLIQAEEVIR